MPNIFDALKQKCLTFLTVFLLENKKDTREISRIFYAAIAPVNRTTNYIELETLLLQLLWRDQQ